MKTKLLPIQIVLRYYLKLTLLYIFFKGTDLIVVGLAWVLVSQMSRSSVTGESPPSLSKELTNSLAGVGDSFDADSQFPLDELKIDPLTLDGLHMLNDPDMVLTDPATEDTFRMDRL